MPRSAFAEVVRIRLARDCELLLAEGRLVGWRVPDHDAFRLISHLRAVENGRLDVLVAAGPRDYEELYGLRSRLANCPAGGTEMAGLLLDFIDDALDVFELDQD